MLLVRRLEVPHPHRSKHLATHTVGIDSFNILGLPVLGFGIDAMQAALSQGKSIMLSFDVTPSFENNQNGFVMYVPNETRGGGHLVHMIGYVSNAQLSATLPNAPQASGGGYFIIKNSWGECWGDGGFAYLPVDFVKDYASAVVVVGFKS